MFETFGFNHKAETNEKVIHIRTDGNITFGVCHTGS